MIRYSRLSYVEESIGTLFPTLLEVLNDIPHVDFDPSLSWNGDSIVFCTMAYLILLLQIGPCPINSSTLQYLLFFKFVTDCRLIRKGQWTLYVPIFLEQ